jgi:hypothetical protein
MLSEYSPHYGEFSTCFLASNSPWAVLAQTQCLVITDEHYFLFRLISGMTIAPYRHV